jgi:serine/threonine protein kinase
LKINPKTEIEIHKRLMKKRSKKVVKIFGDFQLGGFVYLVMEYCKEGSLRDYVKKNGPMEFLLG